MIKDFPIYNYPTNGVTDPNVLYQSLGSFWTQIFSEQGTIKGYTLGQAQQAIQNYRNLIEVIYSYSVKNIEPFHSEAWFPLTILRSQYNRIPLLFKPIGDPDVAVFGPQLSSDQYYAGEVFKFGFPKTPVAEVFTFDPDSSFNSFSVIANRVTNPSLILVNEVDVRYAEGIMYFNQDVFNSPAVAKVNLIGDNGQPITFVDYLGNTIQDQLIVLWVYNAKIDNSALFNNFGFLFDLEMPSSDGYKEILKSIVNLFVEGPTVRAIKALACSFLGVSPVIESSEVIEEIFTDGNLDYIVTDKHVYKYNPYYSLMEGINVGTTVFAGDVLVDAAEYFDYVQSRDWWRNGLAPKASYDNDVLVSYPNMSFPTHIFFGNYQNYFVVKNELELVTKDSNGDIHFPIEGTANDVNAFNNYINNTPTTDSNGNPVLSKVVVAQALGMSDPSVTSTVINPLEFLFQNFFKHGTALLKFNFYSLDQAVSFLSFFETIKDMFPKHVFMLFYFEFNFPNEEYVNLNDIDGTINADGTLVTNGHLPNNTANYYKTSNPNVDQFAFGHAIVWDTTTTPYNTDEIVQANGLTLELVAIAPPFIVFDTPLPINDNLLRTFVGLNFFGHNKTDSVNIALVDGVDYTSSVGDHTYTLLSTGNLPSYLITYSAGQSVRVTYGVPGCVVNTLCVMDGSIDAFYPTGLSTRTIRHLKITSFPNFTI